MLIKSIYPVLLHGGKVPEVCPIQAAKDGAKPSYRFIFDEVSIEPYHALLLLVVLLTIDSFTAHNVIYVSIFSASFALLYQ